MRVSGVAPVGLRSWISVQAEAVEMIIAKVALNESLFISRYWCGFDTTCAPCVLADSRPALDRVTE